MTATRNAKKINRAEERKNTLHAVQHIFLYISLPLFCRTTSTYVKLPSCTFYGGKIVYREVCYYVPFFFFFFTAAHFNLAGRWHLSFSHCSFQCFMFLSSAMNFVSFLFVFVFVVVFSFALVLSLLSASVQCYKGGTAERTITWLPNFVASCTQRRRLQRVLHEILTL